MTWDQRSEIVLRLRQSRPYQDYSLAFAKALNLPLELTSIHNDAEAESGNVKPINPFCAIVAEANKICPSCPQAHPRPSHLGISKTQSIRCFSGFTIGVVPIKLHNQVVGFLKTGVFLGKPSAERFRQIVAQLMRTGVKVDFSGLEDTFFNSRPVSPDFYRSVIRLLETLAHHLQHIADELEIQRYVQDPPIIRRSKDYIERHLSDRIKLGTIARALNMSRFHFCRTFKQATGQTFVDYLSHVRVDRARILLRDRGLRISEIAYEVGFQTLTHFNRTFRRLAGCSPTEYRARTIGGHRIEDRRREG